MKPFSILLTAWVLPLAVTADVCNSGIYASLTALGSDPLAQSFCSQRFPAKTVTVTGSAVVKKRQATTTATTSSAGANDRKPATTTTTNKKTTVSTTIKTSKTSTTTTTTKKVVTTTTTTTKTTTSKPSSTTTTSSKTTVTKSGNPVLSTLSSIASSVAQTLCSCIQPPKTVTVPPTTTSTKTYDTAATPKPCTQEGQQCDPSGPGSQCYCQYNSENNLVCATGYYGCSIPCGSTSECENGYVCIRNVACNTRDPDHAYTSCFPYVECLNPQIPDRLFARHVGRGYAGSRQGRRD